MSMKLLTDFLQQFKRKSQSEIEQRIIELVHYAYNNVGYYHDLMKNSDVHPRQIQSIADYMARFPRSSSTEYRCAQQDNGVEYQISSKFNKDQLKISRTSGSTGIPVSLYRTKQEKELDKARTVYHLVCSGLRPWHKILAVVDPGAVTQSDSFFQSFGIFRRYFIHSGMSVDEMLDIIRENKINAIYGQKSIIMQLVDAYEENGQALKVDLLMPGAERVLDKERERMLKVFQPQNYSEIYGSTETGIIGRYSRGAYIVDQNSVFACLNNEKCIGDTYEGNLVVTSLEVSSQPRLMVDLEDYVIANKNSSNNLSSIRNIQGRTKDYIELKGGEKIPLMYFLGVFDYLEYLFQFRIRQTTNDHCIVELRVNENREEYRQQVKFLLAPIFRNKTTFSVKFVNKIPVEKSGKTKILIKES